MILVMSTNHDSYINFDKILDGVNSPNGDVVTSLGNVSDYPKISVITPSYNQVLFIEETICSVLSQGYPNLEYIVIDGGSTDGTIDVIRKYEPYLTYWISEQDRGQSEALNKGFKISTGDWLAWLNSDDIYLPGALLKIAECIKQQSSTDWIVGATLLSGDIKSTGECFSPSADSFNWVDFVCTKWSGISLPQPSSFWSRKLWLEVGPINELLHYTMDHELWGRMAHKGYRPYCLDAHLAVFRIHSGSKTGNGMFSFYKEELDITTNWIRAVSGVDRRRLKSYRNFMYWFLFKKKILQWLFR